MVHLFKPSLSLDTAEIIVAAAMTKAKESGFLPLSVAVLDAGGHVVLLKRQDGAGHMRNDIACAKAWGAVGMGVPSGRQGKMFAQNPNFLTGLVGASQGRLAPNPGGVLVLDADGMVIGAVGISGDTGPNDEICAIAGIRAAGLTAAGTDSD